LRGEGLGFFVNSAIGDDLAAGRLVQIEPPDFKKLHRDTAMVVRSRSVLERDMLRDFAFEIAVECKKLGCVLEDTFTPQASMAAE
jgi:DNA-binding transcriptional LysR family regulator